MLLAKDISISAGGRKPFLIVVLLMIGIAVHAQRADTAKPWRVVVPAPAFPLQAADFDKQVYRSLIDSLNSRKIALPAIPSKDTLFTTFLHAALPGTPFAGMKDSVAGQFLYYVKNNFGFDRVNKVIKNFTAAGDTISLTNFIGSKIKGFYSISGMESLTIPSFDHFIKPGSNSVQYNVVHDNSGMSPLPWMHQLQAGMQVSLMDIPFEVRYSNLSNAVVPLQYNNLFKLSFNKEGFQQGLQQKLGKYYDMKKYLLADMDVLSYVKKHFQHELRQTLKQASNDVLPDPAAFLEGKLSYDELLKLDMNQIKEKIAPAGQIRAIRDRMLSYETLLRERGARMEAPLKDSLLRYIKNQSAWLSSMDQLTGTIKGVKEKLSASGINANQISRLQQSINSKAVESLQQPAVIKEAAGNLLPLNGLQRLFTQVQSLRAGTFDMQQSERTISALLRGGLELSMLKNNKLFSGGLGQIKDGGFMKDAGLTNSLFNPASFLQFLQFGKGQEGRGQTKVSVVNSNTTSPESALFNQLALPRNILAGTISKTIPVRKSGIVEAEFSKSATQYRNTAGAGADLLMEHKSALLSYADDFWQTLSAGVRYTDDWENIGLSHNAHIAYAGFGYNNPGNPASSKGSWRYDVQLRKQVHKRKGYLQGQFANRQYNYSADGSGRWNNMQIHLQGRYRLSGKLTLGGKWNQYQLVRNEDGARKKMFVSRKAMADVQYAGAIAGRPQRTNFSLGWQQFDNIAVQQNGNSDLLLLQWVSTVAVGNIMVSANLFYNKEIADHALIGDLLTAEMGAGYTLFKSVAFNSSVTYLDNNIAARQLGLRQSVNTTILKNCSIGLYLDCRKNLITPINEYLYGSFRGELSVHYQIN